MPSLFNERPFVHLHVHSEFSFLDGASHVEALVHCALRASVPREGFRAKFRNGTVADVARETLKIARAGLKTRDRQSSTGSNETSFLNILDETLDRDATPAEVRLRRFHEEWNDRIDPIFSEYAY